jgi:hypothetical protein
VGCTEATSTGLVFKDGLTYDEWESVGFDLAKVGKAVQWWIGDWVRHGERKYGETYKAAIDATGVAYQTARNIASACEEFEMSRRRDNLTFKHHVEVQSLDKSEQDELLDQAEKEKWSCAKLRERVKELKGIAAPPEPNTPEQPVASSVTQELETVDPTEPTDSEEYEDIDPPEAEPITFDQTVIRAFERSQLRLGTLRQLLTVLSETELQILKEWLAS